jgi:hypothetical protein
VPAGRGAFLNPCDNSFHHDMKHHFYQTKRTTHADMLRAMISLYYTVKEKNIEHYFEHTRITGKQITKGHISTLLSEGYHPGKGHEEIHEKCRASYQAWKKNIRLINIHVRPNETNVVIQDSVLNGVYWHTHARN